VFKMNPSKRTGLIVVALVFVNFCFTSAILEDREAWVEFKSKYGKKYASETEEEHRMKVFIDNKNYIESHNTKSKANFIQGINPLSDLTTEEINSSRNGFRYKFTEGTLADGLLENLLLALNSSRQMSNSSVSKDRAWFEDILTPSKLDWRKNGRVSKVKDQGSCGSCWSFATTGALESVLASRGKSVLLSEQNLIDCSGHYGNNGCNGGLMDAALRYVHDHGIMSSQDYQYTGKDETCKFVREKSVTQVRGSALLPRGNEILLRIALAMTGPIPIAIDASVRSFHSYKSGVYDDGACRHTENALNHAVLLVGYGTDKVGGEYWLVVSTRNLRPENNPTLNTDRTVYHSQKNSWGSKWADGGYIKIARNRGNLCGVASYAVLPIP